MKHSVLTGKKRAEEKQAAGSLFQRLDEHLACYIHLLSDWRITAALLAASLYTIIVLYGSPGHVWAGYKLTSTNEDWRPSLVVILYTWAEG